MSLYRKTDDTYTNYFHWLYDGPQWWGTGFTGVIDIFVKKNDLIQVSSVDFSSEPKMLEKLEETWGNSRNSRHLIFDIEDHKLWIMW